MTLEDIKKALECCSSDSKKSCKKCPYVTVKGFCYNKLEKDVLDLINQQQTNYESLKVQEEKEHQHCKNVCEPKYKAEIENLKNQVNRLKRYDEKRDIELHSRLMANSRVEGIKEFIEEFTSRLEDYKYHDSTHGYFFYKDSIDHLVNYLKKEMVGEENDT